MKSKENIAGKEDGGEGWAYLQLNTTNNTILSLIEYQLKTNKENFYKLLYLVIIYRNKTKCSSFWWMSCLTLGF